MEHNEKFFGPAPLNSLDDERKRVTHLALGLMGVTAVLTVAFVAVLASF